MKNKRIIIYIIIIIILIVAGITTYFVLNKDRVEKFSSIMVLDTYGTEITNYKENKRAFTLEKNQENDIIKVNGREYTEGTRLYKPGKYEIEVTNDNMKEKSEVVINKIKEDEKNTYSIYLMSETLQTLFASLNIVKDENAQGYFWTSRSSTVNTENMKEKMQNMQISEYIGEQDPNEFINNVIPEAKEYIKNVLQKDENAYFKLYIEDYRFYLDLELLGKAGLDDSRYDVTIYTNGTLTYTRRYEMFKENKYERFNTEKQNYKQIVENVKSNTGNYNNHPGSYLVDKESEISIIDYNYDYLLISTLIRDNINYELQYPEQIKFEDEKIAKEMEKAHLVKITAQEKYNELNEESKELFFENINLDKDELDKEYFNDQNVKYLVITGTVPFYGPNKKEEFEEVIKQVVEDYGKDYVLLYKPHPRALPTEEQEKFLNDLKIKVLPGSIPMEAIMFIYPNIKLGGFGSSIYMSVDKGQTEFFFAREVNELYNPLNELYDSLFSNAKLYNLIAN